MQDPLADRVIRILAEQAVLDHEHVARDQTLDDLGIDSMGLVECIFTLEEEFDISVPFNANDPAAGAFDISSVDAIIGAVRGLVAEQKGS